MKNTKWFCDNCGQLIEKIEDGWVEWLNVHAHNGNKEKEYGIRLVHHKPASPKNNIYGCQYDDQKQYKQNQATVKDLPLESFVESNGLIELLEMLKENKLPQDDIIEMIKRLHIPNYEEARIHFKQAISEGVIEPNRLDGFYSQEQIQRIIDWVENKGI